MKFSRRTGLIAATAGLALVLSGCAGADSDSSGDGVTTINYWSWDGAPGQDLVEPIIESFEAENPDIEVNYTEIPQTDYKAKAAQSLGAGEDIDVLTVQPGAWSGEVEDYLLPVSDWPVDDDLESEFTAQSVEQAKRLFSDGELYAVPVYSTGSVVGVYNADILSGLGVTPPSTWAEFAALSDALAAQGEGILPVTMPSEDWFQDEVALTAVGQVDPDFFNAVRYDEGAWNTPEYVQGLEDYKALYDTGAFDSSTLDMDYATAMTTFDEGKSAVVFNGSWEAGRILTGNYGIVPFPAENADDASLRAFLDVMLGIPAESTKQDAAAKFIEYMSVGAGVDEWASALKGVPALDGYELPDGVLTTDLQKQSYELLVDLINNPHGDRNNLGAFADFVGANVKQVLHGAMTAEEAADSDQAELEKGNF
ncbi:ABC transporter substrate-binding protein [Compostimonas suwonensis]|uniref:ABC-type glycerol-3-phosphate transport system substrate-binding protein n=1 Tax=Compostimonas suwonensis TaxID=1048394 RepID=A0A2M9C587_9MICO|nr:extracellular solute-binding protein [Compostimonas suwonensis]PJJ65637.1 ABC-type glycerol-3-phosphate transport system substrate-binding protein [Compostimonas suwonensis]